MSIKEEFKDLFWSSLTEQEIKDEIGLTHREYHDLLRECKLELGLPTSYRRNPARWDMYNINSYFIIYYFDDDFKIIKYSPTLRSAELDLEKYLKDNPDYYDGEFEIKKASDENIGELIFYEYFIQGSNWERIIIKLKIPYHKFYEILNKLKKRYNRGISNQERYITKKEKRFIVHKVVNNKYTIFGEYNNLEVAKCVRDYLEDVNWDKNLLVENEDEIIRSIVEH